MLLLIKLAFILIMSLFYTTSEAQPGGCGAFPLPPCGPGEPVPITGIEILIGAGALLGAKRMIARRKNNI